MNVVNSNHTWILETSPYYQPLHDAALSGDARQLESLLTPEIDINAMYGDGLTGRSLLHLAASKGNAEVVRSLLHLGIDVDILDEDPYGRVTPLIDAAGAADLDTIRLLVEAGANINFKTAEKRSPVNMVISRVGFQNNVLEERHLDCVRYFLDLGLDINNQECEWEGGGTIVRPVRFAISFPSNTDKPLSSGKLHILETSV
jgi:ankyrin repeat protein